MNTDAWRSLSNSERADAYSPSKALPDGDLSPYLEAYARDSAQVYAAHPDFQTLSYGDAPTQSIDVFKPKAGANHPLHVFIHGGYWQALSKRNSVFPATGFLEHGIAFAAIDYTLAPDATLDEIVIECIAAVTHLFKSAETLGIDPQRISLSGSSAGAHLVAMTCLGLAPKHRPSAAVLLSGIYDLEPLIGTYVNVPLKLDILSARQNSPLRQDLTTFPKTLIAWGEIETDEFKRQSQAFADLLTDVEIHEIKDRNHFDIVYDLSNTSALASRIKASITS